MLVNHCKGEAQIIIPAGYPLKVKRRFYLSTMRLLLLFL